MEIGVPSVLPSNVPESIRARSASWRGLTMDDWEKMAEEPLPEVTQQHNG